MIILRKLTIVIFAYETLQTNVFGVFLHPARLKLDYWHEKFIIYTANLFGSDSLFAMVEREIDGLMATLSAPERAELEICYLLPSKVTFTEAALILENLAKMGPNIIQELLQTCRSIKTKRLFLYLTKYYGHPWLTKINLNDIDLGKVTCHCRW